MAYSTIPKPSLYFNTKLYTGNGGTQSITGVGFQSDFTWIKRRDTTNNHRVTDAIRGVTKEIYPDDTSAQDTRTGGLTAFGADGFTVGDSAGYNANSGTYASWNWKANGQGSSNTDGSINTTYTSVNTTAGFSISTYTGNNTSGATVGHGLGAVPKMIIVKRLDSADAWCTYHVNIGNTRRAKLNTTDNYSTGSGYWNNTSPTSTVFTIGNSSEVNGSGGNYVAYCFADVAGFAKFGGYTGDNNANGNFCYLGFKPAFVILKNWTSSGFSWELFDNKRNTTDGVANVIQKRLYPDSNAAEGGSSSTNYIDFLSNGFKIRRAGDSNENNSNYIFMAFAEEPLVANSGTSGVPATAK